MAQALPVTSRNRGRTHRSSRLAVGGFVVMAVSFGAGSACADACFDASDEARALLARRKLVDARGQLRVCAASSCEDAVRVLCDERLAEVSARLPTLVFDVKDHQGRDRTDVELVVDGVPYPDGARGAEITLDPGPHVFVFSASDEAPFEQRFVLMERDKGRREHVVLGRPAAPPSLAVQGVPAQPVTAGAAPPWRTAGWITVAAGAVALGIGTAYGITAIEKNNDAHCNPSNVCDDPRSRHEARLAANISTASILVGGALAGGGVAILAFGPRATTRTSGPTSLVVAASSSVGTLGLTRSW